MSRRGAFEFSGWEFGDGDSLWACLGDQERKRLSLRRLEHLVALRDAQGWVASRDRQALINRAIQSVFHDCQMLGLTREACALLERGDRSTWSD
ncbi:MAG: hypothetical protein HY690_19375 [Chloroflexi bacterium]|nr:hypothetical protein [Chloroflexota bacterium]